MDPVPIVVATATALAVSCLVLAPIVAKASLARVSAAFAAMQKEASGLVLDLQRQQARAASTVRTVSKRVDRLQGLPAAADGTEIDVPDWLIVAARGAGIDPQALLDGDPAQQAKLKAVMAGIQKERPAAGGGAAIEGLPPEDSYI